jgi:hypothetical protein
MKLVEIERQAAEAEQNAREFVRCIEASASQKPSDDILPLIANMAAIFSGGGGKKLADGLSVGR